MSVQGNNLSASAGGGNYPPTCWSDIIRAKDGSPAALATLCELYWYPVYAFMRRRGKSHHEAQDLTQEFFARMIEKDLLKVVDQDKGRFRAFLRTVAHRLVCSEWQRSQAQKRSGRITFVTWDGDLADERFRHEPVDGRTPDTAFDRNWAEALMRHAMDDLKAEFARAQEAQLLKVLEPFVGGEAAHGGYREAAEQLGITEGYARQRVRRIRIRYGELIEERIRQIVDSDEAFEEERQSLMGAWAASEPAT